MNRNLSIREHFALKLLLTPSPETPASRETVELAERLVTQGVLLDHVVALVSSAFKDGADSLKRNVMDRAVREVPGPSRVQ